MTYIAEEFFNNYRLFEWHNPNLDIDDWVPDLKWPSPGGIPHHQRLSRTVRHQTLRAHSKESSVKESVNLRCGNSWCRFRIQCYKLRDTSKKKGGSSEQEQQQKQESLQSFPAPPEEIEGGDWGRPGAGEEVPEVPEPEGKSADEKGYRKKDVNVFQAVKLGVVGVGAEQGRGGGGEVAAEDQHYDEEPLVVVESTIG